jgi:hypothetical protein
MSYPYLRAFKPNQMPKGNMVRGKAYSLMALLRE